MTEPDAIQRARKAVRGRYGADAIAVQAGLICELISLASLAKPQPVGLTAFDEAVAAELPLVSSAPYNSREICQWFSEGVRARLATLSAPVAQPTVAMQAEPVAGAPSDEAIARAWFDADYGAIHDRAPGYVYTFLRRLAVASVPIEEYRRVVARCIELGEKLVAAKQDDPATNKWWFDQGKKVADEIYQGEFQPPERERCESCGGSGVWSAAQPGEAVPAEPRCNLCYYKHGHCIGCPNNPVDLALAEKVNAAIEAHRAAPAQAAAVPEAVERDALREVLKQLLLEFGLQETFGIRLARAALSQGDVSGEGEGS